MGMAASSLGRWTRRFTVASAFSLVVAQTATLLGFDRLDIAVIVVFGFFCPMIFGMAYLLVPSFVGKTLVDQRLAAIHFGLAFGGAMAIIVHELFDLGAELFRIGVLAWSVGVAVFVGALAWTVVPAVRERPAVVMRTAEKPQRSTRVATFLIPVPIGYLVVGSLALLGRSGFIPAFLPSTFPGIIHFYAAGLGALLIFTLGARLLVGFFHVVPPRRLTWVVLVTGAIGPGLLATHLWGGPWFRIGAAFEATAMVGYGLLVGTVAVRSNWRRTSLWGISFGAVSGVAAVTISSLVAFGLLEASLIDVHATFILGGFFPLTIVGYAYHFFAVTSGSFVGATDRGALTTIGLLAVGVALRATGLLGTVGWVSSLGAGVGLLGALGYCYLIGRRLLFDRA